MITVIRAGRLIDGTGAQPVDAATIVVEDGRVREVASDGHGQAPTGADVQLLDYSDLTVLPGLIDCHVHLVFSARATALNDILTESDQRIMLRAVHNAQLALTAGATTVRDLGGKAGVTLVLRDAINDGILPGPRILAAGPAITTTGGHCYFLDGEADTAEDLRRMARSLVKRGVDLFKVMSTGGRMTPGTNVTAAQFSVEELSELVAEARRANRTVASHGHGAAGIRNSIAAGVTTIEHCSWVSQEDSGQVDFDPAAAAEMARKGIFMDGTLSTGMNLRKLPIESLTGSRLEVRLMQPHIREAQRQTLAAGVEPVAGTDAGVANVTLDSIANELECLVTEMGLTPLEAIRAGTHTAARANKLEHEIGSITPGRCADLIAVEGDPSRDINDVRRLRWVLRNGVVEVENGRLVRS